VLQVVVGGRHATASDARRDALEEASDAALAYLRQELGGRVGDWHVPLSFVDDNLIEGEYTEKIESDLQHLDQDFEHLYRTHLLVRLNPSRRHQMAELWRQDVAAHGIWLVGGAVALVMLLLACVLAYLKLDEATQGYYRGWLNAGAAAAVLGIAGLAILLYS
jgi:hypothetical protein